MPVTRPPVSIVIPFLGDRSEAEEVLAAARPALSEGDEVVLADNSPDGVAAGLGSGPVRVVAAPEQRSSYYARNVGAEAAAADWLLFVDADCRPSPDILDRYFEPEPEAEVGALAGRVEGVPGQPGLVPRYSRSREVLDQEAHFRDAELPYANTSNLLVRREAWASVGGFHEGIRSGGDVDFCWRIQDHGWRLDLRLGAVVRHVHRESVKSLVRQMARYGGGRAWLGRRHPGRADRFPAERPVARALVGAAGLAVLGKRERATFRFLDALHFGSFGLGWFFGNRSPSPHGPAPPSAGLRIAIVCDQFPELSETFIVEEARALQEAGHAVRVEARARAGRPNPGAARGLDVRWQEDDGIGRRLADTARLALAAPGAVLRDLRDRRRWAADEDWVPPLRVLAPVARRLRRDGVRHLHAHFAAVAALDALRLARLLGVSWSLTAHAYDIYAHPRNLRTKLAAAAFVTSGCDYTVRDLGELMPAGRAGDVHEIVMGVDLDRFRRRSPYPGGRTLLAIGRLVEKKGFQHLVEAMGMLEGTGTVERLVIVGSGPLEGELRERAERAGVAGRIEWEGGRSPEEVRELIEAADLLAMPCVVAADGDRDSMPVVVKEALAMEVPVVCSDEVGLPELVRPEWGRLVAPGDPAALAGAIRELLDLPSERRVEMGRAGREFVGELADVHAESAKLAALVEAAQKGR